VDIVPSQRHRFQMNNQRRLLPFFFFFGALFAIANASAEPDPTNPTIPSFYQEGGFAQGHGSASTHGNERIDTFAGKLQWHNADLVIPGPGGFDLVVKRSYSSPDLEYPEPSPVGCGWTMHYGRVTRNALVSTGKRMDSTLLVSTTMGILLSLPKPVRMSARSRPRTISIPTAGSCT